MSSIYADGAAEQNLCEHLIAQNLSLKSPDSNPLSQRVLADIEHGKVFDDIMVEYDAILEEGFKNLGYSLD